MKVDHFLHPYLFWDTSCRRDFKLLSERVLIVDECAKRRVVKLNVSLTSSRCVRESEVKTEIFWGGNANSFESLFTWMMCCLIKRIYIWGMNSFLTSFVFLTVKRKEQCNFYFWWCFMLKKKKKKLGASESIKKTALQTYSSKNYNNTKVHQKGGQNIQLNTKIMGVII